MPDDASTFLADLVAHDDGECDDNCRFCADEAAELADDDHGCGAMWHAWDTL